MDYVNKISEDRWEAPEWAKEQTLNDIRNSSASMAKLIEVIANSSTKDTETAKKLLNEYKKSNGINEDIKDALSRTNKETKTVGKKIDSASGKSTKEHYETVRSYERMSNSLENYSRSIEGHIRTLSSTLDDNFGNMGTSIGNIVGNISGAFTNFLGGPIFGRALGSAVSSIVSGGIGMVVGMLQSYADSLVRLSDSGAAFGNTLSDLRGYAAAAGMNLEAFSNLIASNTSVLRAFGGGASQSMQAYAEISSMFLSNAENANYFGMRISDLNDVLMDEIELRRRSGQLTYTSASRMADSMEELLFQTTAMASLTGQNRRDMLRNRQEMMSDSSLSAYAATLNEYQSQAFLSISNFQDLFGENITRGIQSGIASGFGIERFIAPQLAMLDQVFAGDMREVFARYQEGIENAQTAADVERMQQEMLFLINDANINQSGVENLIRIAEANGANSQAARDALELLMRSRGIIDQNLTLQQIMDMTANERAAILSQDTAGLPAQTEIFANAIRASFAESLDNFIGFDNVGGSIGAALSQFTDYFRDGENPIPIDEAIQRIGPDLMSALAQVDTLEVLKDIRDFLGPTGSTVVLILGALAAINTTLGVISAARGIGGLLGLGGGAAATTAAAAGSSVALPLAIGGAAIAGGSYYAANNAIAEMFGSISSGEIEQYRNGTLNPERYDEITEELTDALDRYSANLEEYGDNIDWLNAPMGGRLATEQSGLIRDILGIENPSNISQYTSLNPEIGVGQAINAEPEISTVESIPADQRLLNRDIANFAERLIPLLERRDVENEERIASLIAARVAIPESLMSQVDDRSAERRLEQYNDMIQELRQLRQSVERGNRGLTNAIQDGPS